MTSRRQDDQSTTAAQIWRHLRAVVLDQHNHRAEACAVLDLSFIRMKALLQVATITSAGAQVSATADQILNRPPAALLALGERDLADLGRVLDLLDTLTAAGAVAARAVDRQS